MTTTAGSLVEPGTWPIDAVHSVIGFTIRHAGVNVFRGEFKDVTGSLEAAEDATLTITGSAPVSAIAVNSDELKAHLLSADFFGADEHPNITFASESISTDGDEIVVAGVLTIKGHSQPVEARGQLAAGAIDLYGNPRVGLAVEAVIDRRDFGIDWNAELPKGGLALSNDVALNISLAFVKS
jgi:polyisoprenoid-binding protein YceI